VHHHTIVNLKGAGRLQRSLSFNLYQTYPARTNWFERRVMTQRRDIDSGRLGRFEDRLSHLSGDLATVYRDVYKRHY
jgi:hypothetical protein